MAQENILESSAFRSVIVVAPVGCRGQEIEQKGMVENVEKWKVPAHISLTGTRREGECCQIPCFSIKTEILLFV